MEISELLMVYYNYYYNIDSLFHYSIDKVVITEIVINLLWISLSIFIIICTLSILCRNNHSSRLLSQCKWIDYFGIQSHRIKSTFIRLNCSILFSVSTKHKWSVHILLNSESQNIWISTTLLWISLLIESHNSI